MVIVDVAAEDGEKAYRILLAAVTVLQVAGHLDTVLGHDQLVDFFSLPQFFFEKPAVFVGVGDLCAEVMVQLVVGDCPTAIRRMTAALADGVIGKLLDFVFIHIDISFLIPVFLRFAIIFASPPRYKNSRQISFETLAAAFEIFILAKRNSPLTLFYSSVYFDFGL